MLIQNVKSFAESVRASRIESGATQAEFAKQVGMSVRWVQGFEAGTINPTLGAAIRTANALGLELKAEMPMEAPEIDAIFAELS